MSGSVMASDTDGAFDAIRFFAPLVVPVTVGKTTAILGPVVGSNSGKSVEVARWRIPEGVVLTALSLPGTTSGTSPELRSVISATRRLDREEWENLVNASNGCGLFGESGASETSAITARGQDSGSLAPGATAGTTQTTSVP